MALPLSLGSKHIGRLGSIAVLAVAASLGSNAFAAPITQPSQLVGATTLIDFNSLSASYIGSSLTISGVSFTGNLSAKSTAGYTAPTNYPTYVSGIALGLPALPGASTVFKITFGTSVSQLGFGIWDPNFQGNLITAYDAGGTLLESTSPDALFPTGGSGADYVGFSRDSADIKFIEIVAGSQNGISDGIWIDNLSFGTANSVPTPDTLSLTLTGLLAVAASVRRRRA